MLPTVVGTLHKMVQSQGGGAVLPGQADVASGQGAKDFRAVLSEVTGAAGIGRAPVHAASEQEVAEDVESSDGEGAPEDAEHNEAMLLEEQIADSETEAEQTPVVSAVDGDDGVVPASISETLPDRPFAATPVPARVVPIVAHKITPSEGIDRELFADMSPDTSPRDAAAKALSVGRSDAVDARLLASVTGPVAGDGGIGDAEPEGEALAGTFDARGESPAPVSASQAKDVRPSLKGLETVVDAAQVPRRAKSEPGAFTEDRSAVRTSEQPGSVAPEKRVTVPEAQMPVLGMPREPSQPQTASVPEVFGSSVSLEETSRAPEPGPEVKVSREAQGVERRDAGFAPKSEPREATRRSGIKIDPAVAATRPESLVRPMTLGAGQPEPIVQPELVVGERPEAKGAMKASEPAIGNAAVSRFAETGKPVQVRADVLEGGRVGQAPKPPVTDLRDVAAPERVTVAAPERVTASATPENEPPKTSRDERVSVRRTEQPVAPVSAPDAPLVKAAFVPELRMARMAEQGVSADSKVEGPARADDARGMMAPSRDAPAHRIPLDPGGTAFTSPVVRAGPRLEPHAAPEMAVEVRGARPTGTSTPVPADAAKPNTSPETVMAEANLARHDRPREAGRSGPEVLSPNPSSKGGTERREIVKQESALAWQSPDRVERADPVPARPGPVAQNSVPLTPVGPMTATVAPAGSEPRATEPLADLALPGQADLHGQTRPGVVTPAPGSAAAGQAAPPQVLQVSAAIQGSSERAFDIHLSPAELGKVRISLSPSESGLTVTILADRPETLDLLRRHVDLLAQDFRDLGYDSTAFSFGAESRGESGGDNGEAKPDRAEPSVTPETTRQEQVPHDPITRMAASGRMDLRL